MIGKWLNLLHLKASPEQLDLIFTDYRRLQLPLVIGLKQCKRSFSTSQGISPWSFLYSPCEQTLLAYYHHNLSSIPIEGESRRDYYVFLPLLSRGDIQSSVRSNLVACLSSTMGNLVLCKLIQTYALVHKDFLLVMRIIDFYAIT